MKTYTLEQLKPFFIGQGSERVCYHSPQNPSYVIKLSPKNRVRQTKRELTYFEFLKNHKVPFTHLPEFGGVVSVKGYIGFEQQAVVNLDGSLSQTLAEYFQTHSVESVPLKALLEDLYAYMYKYNILPCDLNKNNILIQFEKNGPKLVLVDGIGNTDFIPLGQYWKWWGRRKIARKWPRFMKKEIDPLFQ